MLAEWVYTTPVCSKASVDAQLPEGRECIHIAGFLIPESGSAVRIVTCDDAHPVPEQWDQDLIVCSLD